MNSPEFAQPKHKADVFRQEINRLVNGMPLDEFDRQYVMIDVKNLRLIDIERDVLGLQSHIERCEIAKINNIYEEDGDIEVFDPVYQVVFSGELNGVVEQKVYTLDQYGFTYETKLHSRTTTPEGHNIGISNSELIKKVIDEEVGSEERNRLLSEVSANVQFDQAMVVTDEDDPLRFRALIDMLTRLK